ncbi:MAG: flagellar hook-associated protein FlgL [Candidimonas sp.]|nr:flagellar hook-associated protein FlgL [Candidimonas sp.]
MRISSTLFFQTGLNSINAQQSDLMHLYQQVGSGRRMVTPADDPLSAAQAINIRQSQSLNVRFGENRGVLKQNLGTEENTLFSVTTLLQDIKTRLIEAGNGTMSDADRATLGNVLSNARTNLLGLANATDGSGQYLFSGARGDIPPFQDVGGSIQYQGDQFQRLIQADQTRRIAGSDVGTDVFNRAAPGTTGYISAADKNNNGTVVVSRPAITDAHGSGVGHTYSIEFTSETDYTVNVTDADNNTIYSYNRTDYAPGSTETLNLEGGVQVAISGTPVAGDKFVVEPISASPFTAVPQTTMPGAIIGTPRVSDSALVNENSIFGIQFDGAGQYSVYRMNPNDPTNIAAGTLVPPPAPYVPGDLNTITLPDGMSLQMTGAVTAMDTVIVKPTSAASNTNLNIFDTLDRIIASLENPIQGDAKNSAAFQNTLASAIQRIDVNYNNVLTVRASVGARMNEIDAIDANGSLRGLGYSSLLSKMEDLDYYSATAQLQLRTSALEAAALAFRKIQGTSLFNMGSN